MPIIWLEELRVWPGEDLSEEGKRRWVYFFKADSFSLKLSALKKYTHNP
jgi:hypothetical protein